jgi:hypothetical protein
LLENFITCMKNEGGNLSTFAQILVFVISCTPLALLVPSSKVHVHAFNKTCQYACNDTNVFVGFCEVSLNTIYVI